jgi:hypothetical protein
LRSVFSCSADAEMTMARQSMESHVARVQLMSIRWRFTSCFLLILFLLGRSVFAQAGPTGDPTKSTGTWIQLPTAKADGDMQKFRSVPGNHPFWDRTNLLLFSGVAVFRGLDYASTRNFEARGKKEGLLPQDVVDNSAAFAGIEAAGAATSVAISYLFHRTGHHKMERWLSIGHISVAAVGVGWNYSLKTARRPAVPQ